MWCAHVPYRVAVVGNHSEITMLIVHVSSCSILAIQTTDSDCLLYYMNRLTRIVIIGCVFMNSNY